MLLAITALGYESCQYEGKATEEDRIGEQMAQILQVSNEDEKYIKDEIEKHAHRTLLLELTPEHICGKRVTES